MQTPDGQWEAKFTPRTEAARDLISMLSSIRGLRLGAPGAVYTTIEHAVLDLATTIRYAPDPTALPDGINPAPTGACFLNAATLADTTGWQYVEGYAHNGLFSTLHAWCLTPNGEVVDPTWASLPLHLPDAPYLGVPITAEFRRAYALGARISSVLDDAMVHRRWTARWGRRPLLMRGVLLDADGAITGYRRTPNSTPVTTPRRKAQTR